MFSFEKEMTPIVVQWLLDAEFLVRTETMTSFGYCDITAYHRGHQRLIAIELKMDKITEVFRQAKDNVCFAESYIAMPRDAAEKALGSGYYHFLSNGVGVISVEKDKIEILCDASHRALGDYHGLHDRIVNRHTRDGNRFSKRTK